MGWMNISYVLAFLAVFVASLSQILLKQSAEMEHKNFIFKFLNWRVILGYGLLFGTIDSECICLPGCGIKVTPMIESTGIIWVTILAVSCWESARRKEELPLFLLRSLALSYFLYRHE